MADVVCISAMWCVFRLFLREGTFIAFDCETPQMRDAFVKEMRNKGVNVGGCGERGELFHLLLLQRPVRADGSLMCLL